jgi:uncharacterized membrane-anchored protein YhcB (DUF1043 family)
LHCNGFVPVAFLVISLIILRFILSQLTNKKKETDMEQVKKRVNKVRTIVINGVKSTIETVWAIGTSIAGTDVLKERSIFSSQHL